MLGWDAARWDESANNATQCHDIAMLLEVANRGNIQIVHPLSTITLVNHGIEFRLKASDSACSHKHFQTIV